MQTSASTHATARTITESMENALTAGSTFHAESLELSTKCNCFYIGKSQRCVKTHVQEHIGEVTKLYNENILLPNQASHRPCYLVGYFSNSC